MESYLYYLMKDVDVECMITTDAMAIFKRFFSGFALFGVHLISQNLNTDHIESLFSEEYVELGEINIHNFSEIAVLKDLMKERNLEYIEAEISYQDFFNFLKTYGTEEAIELYQRYVENYIRNFIRLFISKYGYNINQNNISSLIYQIENRRNSLAISEDDNEFEDSILSVLQDLYPYKRLTKKSIKLISLILINLALVIGVKVQEGKSISYCVPIVRENILRSALDIDELKFNVDHFLSKYFDLSTFRNTTEISKIVQRVCEELIDLGQDENENEDNRLKISSDCIKQAIKNDNELFYICRFLGVKIKPDKIKYNDDSRIYFP